VPELPEITVYVERIRELAGGQVLDRIRLASPFALRTVDPPPAALAGRTLTGASRLGKRIVLEFTEDYFAVMHLMLSGRLHWREPGAALHRRHGILALDFAVGSLQMTEASSKHRASLHLIAGKSGLEQFWRGGADVLTATPEELAQALKRQNRTLKRALSDPTIVDGIGNTFSDETLHRARLSPFALTRELSPEEILRLHSAASAVLCEWIERLRSEAGEGFPRKGATGRPELAVHGKFGHPCPVCGAPVQRIVYADSEANYCPGCQTGGRVYADRSLSRLLRDDWPKTLEELERLERMGPAR